MYHTTANSISDFNKFMDRMAEKTEAEIALSKKRKAEFKKILQNPTNSKLFKKQTIRKDRCKKEELDALYIKAINFYDNNNISLRDCADKMGICYKSFYSRMVKERGLLGRAKKSKNAFIIEDYLNGVSVADMQAKHATSETYVYSCIRNYKIKQGIK